MSLRYNSIMKKYFFILFFIFALPVFSKEAYINQAQCNDYKKDLNEVFNYTIPALKQDVVKIYKETENEQDFYVRRTIIEQGMASLALQLYMDIANATIKYVNIEQDIPHTNWYGELQEIFTPYIETCKVDTSKLDDFLKYLDKKQFQLETKYRR